MSFSMSCIIKFKKNKNKETQRTKLIEKDEMVILKTDLFGR